MSLALRQPAAPRAAIPDGWIALGQAARLLGVSAAHLTRSCAAWAESGRARKFAGVWAVHPSADPRLREVESWDARDRRQLGESRAAGVKPDYLEVAQARRDLVIGFDDADLPGRTQADQLAVYLAAARAAGRIGPGSPLPVVSPRTFARWTSDYRDGGIAALVPSYGGGGGDGGGGDGGGAGVPPVPAIGPRAEHELRTQLLCGNNIRVGTAYRVVQALAARSPDDPAWRLPSLRTVQLWWSRQPKALKVLANKGERAARAMCVPKMKRHYDAIPAGDTYVGDERTFDVMCRVKTARGWVRCREVKLTAWLDLRSRFLVGWVIRPFADSGTILAALKHAIREHGRPRALVVDWGRDYRKAVSHRHTRGALVGGQRRWDLRRFDGDYVGDVMDQLRIEVKPVAPYTPWAKPIESFFAQMSERFDKRMAAYWGNCPQNRHQDRDAWSRENVHLLPTVEELTAAFDDWLHEYHAAPHGGEGMFGLSPAQAMEKFRDGPIGVETEDSLDFLFSQFVGPRVVGRDGIRHANMIFGWGDPMLMRMQGQKVMLAVQLEDLSSLIVCDMQRRPIVKITPYVLSYDNARDAAEAAKTRRRALLPYRDEVSAARRAIIHSPAVVLPAPGESREADERTPSTDAEPLRIVTARPELQGALDRAGENAPTGVRAPEPIEITADDLVAGELEDDAAPVAADEFSDDGWFDDTEGDE